MQNRFQGSSYSSESQQYIDPNRKHWSAPQHFAVAAALGQGSLLPLSQGEAFTLASINYLAILVKYMLAKKTQRRKSTWIALLVSDESPDRCDRSALNTKPWPAAPSLPWTKIVVRRARLGHQRPCEAPTVRLCMHCRLESFYHSERSACKLWLAVRVRLHNHYPFALLLSFRRRSFWFCSKKNAIMIIAGYVLQMSTSTPGISR